jgi:hypothetical protein
MVDDDAPVGKASFVFEFDCNGIQSSRTKRSMTKRSIAKRETERKHRR